MGRKKRQVTDDGFTRGEGDENVPIVAASYHGNERQNTEGLRVYDAWFQHKSENEIPKIRRQHNHRNGKSGRTGMNSVSFSLRILFLWSFHMFLPLNHNISINVTFKNSWSSFLVKSVGQVGEEKKQLCLITGNECTNVLQRNLSRTHASYDCLVGFMAAIRVHRLAVGRDKFKQNMYM